MGQDPSGKRVRTSLSDSAPAYIAFAPASEGAVGLAELLDVLWRGKWQIFFVALGFCISGATYSLLATPLYRSEVILALNSPDDQMALPAGLGGLAGLAGFSLGAPRDSAQAIATLRSRVFVEDFILDNDLLPVLFADDWDATDGNWLTKDLSEQPTIWDGVNYFVEEIRTVSEDAETGLITLTIDWQDPAIAKSWADELVVRINERLRARDLGDSERRLTYLNSQLGKASLVELRQAISSLIEDQVETMMLAQAETEYAFRIIDPPRIPDEPFHPRLLLITVLAVFVGGMFGIVIVLLRWAASAGSIEE